MREDLGELNGKRLRFWGTFERYGSKYERGFREVKTVLLRDIKRSERVITDHLWLNCTKGFERLGELQNGDLIQFEARVNTYLKGYGSSENKKIDYKLSHPTKIKIICKKMKEDDHQ